MLKRKLEIMKNLIPSKQNTSTVKLLVKGEKGQTITLAIENGENIALTSAFIGIRFKWYVMDIEGSDELSDTIVVVGNSECIRIELQIELSDVSLIETKDV